MFPVLKPRSMSALVVTKLLESRIRARESGDDDIEKFAELVVQDYAKKTIQGLMNDPAFVQAMDEHYEKKWAHRFD